MTAAAAKAQLDLTHDAETHAEHAATRAGIRDIEQAFLLEVEQAARRAAKALEAQGWLDRWYQCGDLPCRVSADEAVAICGEELGLEAKAGLEGFYSRDARDAFAEAAE